MTSDDLQNLITGGDDPFLPRLLHEINRATDIDIAVAFIKQKGLELLSDALMDALARHARLRFVTGDYLHFTDPQAFRQLMLFQDKGAEVKVFETVGNQSFHMKAYIFAMNHADGDSEGIAYIGSSNITYSALKEGLEWNLGVRRRQDPERFGEIQRKFKELFHHQNTKLLSHSWIDEYQASHQGQPAVIHEPGVNEVQEPVTPHVVQREALQALRQTREAGFRRGLVVMATGLGKTWLSALDSIQLGAERVLFVAHREEILDQAESTFLRIRPEAKIGRYQGKRQDSEADMLFASVQTLGRQYHLDNFAADYFDYIVVDEFHHAAARTYQRLLAHFEPKFLLGLTATPDRTDQADILSLCDDNLVCHYGMKAGIEHDLLCPFHYFGIADENVDYQAIPWRSGKFDPTELYNQLATHRRANHALEQWRKHKQERTLAFCMSKRHADFMAQYFNRNGHKAVSVHSDSEVRRNEALARLANGEIDVIFSVDLFNEGVDLPAIDTVLMLRPTESKILFLQQLGRGLRTHKGKERLKIVDFVGNHISFFRKLEALFGIGVTNRERRKLIEQLKNKEYALPDGCEVNHDLKALAILERLVQTEVDTQESRYRSLREALGRRPTLSEFFTSGGGVTAIRKEHGQWLAFVASEGDLRVEERECFQEYSAFFLEVETTPMTKSFKMVLLEALVKLDGFSQTVPLRQVAETSYKVIQRRRPFHPDLPEWVVPTQELDDSSSDRWLSYWNGNPVNAWVGGNRPGEQASFEKVGDGLTLRRQVDQRHTDAFHVLLQELINYRYAQYEERLTEKVRHDDNAPKPPAITKGVTAVSFFSDLRIACGHFADGTHADESIEQISLPRALGDLDPATHFVARATGDSMDGRDSPVKDGDHLLLQLVKPGEDDARLDGAIVALGRKSEDGANQYILRQMRSSNGGHRFVANNPAYPPISKTDTTTIVARLVRVIDPIDTYLHRSIYRRDIPPLFGMEFNEGLWRTGHIRPKGSPYQILLVTLNKRGMVASQQYHDYFVDHETFHWQSQASTTVRSAKGQAIINHERDGVEVHLFVRRHGLEGGKAAPFIYCGRLSYKNHTGEKPMSVVWGMENPSPSQLLITG